VADSKISQLPAGVAAATTLLPGVNAGSTQRITVQSVLDLVGVIQGPPGVDGAPGVPGVDGADGLPGESVTVFESATEPTAARIGDLWIEPQPDGQFRLYVWTSTGWEVVSSGTGSPTLVSEDEPTGTFPEGALWIDPTCDPTVTGTGTFSNLNPPVYVDPPVTQQANGLSIGLSPDGLEYHDLHPCVGAVPVSVGGKTYLMPLFEAPSDLRAAPLFTFDDSPTTQTLAGDYIGVSPDGQVYFEPSTAGGIPVVVAGKTYLLPLWER
jgi:hypothetical protein